MQKLKATLQKIKPVDKTLLTRAQEKLDALTKPKGSLGVLEEIAKQVVGITEKMHPVLKNKFIVTVAADHGVCREGVSAYPQEVTAQMVANFLDGGAAINVLAGHVHAKVVIVDAGIACKMKPRPGLTQKRAGSGTKNIAAGPAMTRDQAVICIENGIELAEALAEQDADIIGTGEMGIGNTTSASAIVSVITGTKPESVTGRGTGITEAMLANKIAVIAKAIAANKPDPADGIDVLAKLGGFEIGTLAGIFLGCAASRIPVVIDGFISGAAALIAGTIKPEAKDYMLAAHCSVERGHKVTLDYMGLKPLLNLDMRLGEGTGAALGINLIEAATKILNEMATFASAGVAREKP